MLEIIFEVLLAIIIVAFVVIIAYSSITGKKKSDKVADIDEYINSEGEIITTHAEIIDVDCGTKMVGSKTPKLVEWYLVTFKTGDGEIMEISVDAEMYEGLEVGLKGELTTINGQLNSFLLD